MYNAEDYTKKTTNTTKVDVELLLPLKTYQKIMGYATICDTEITGFADVEYNPETKKLIAGEVYLLEQEGAAAHVHMEEEDVSKFNMEMIKKGKTQLPRIWWHSHVNMEAFFSGTDETTLRELQNESFIIALVVNKRFNMQAKMYIATEVTMLNETKREFLEIDPLPVRIQLEYAVIPEALKKEVEKKVTTRKYVAPTPMHLPYKNPFKNVKGTKKTFFTGGKDLGEAGDTDIDRVAKYENKLTNVMYLPKNQADARSRIDTLGLERKWDYQLEEWVWENYATGETWIDYWESVGNYYPVDNE